MGLPAFWRWAKDRGTETFLVGMLILGVLVNGLLFSHNQQQSRWIQAQVTSNQQAIAANEAERESFRQELARNMERMRLEHAAISARLERLEGRR